MPQEYSTMELAAQAYNAQFDEAQAAAIEAAQAVAEEAASEAAEEAINGAIEEGLIDASDLDGGAMEALQQAYQDEYDETAQETSDNLNDSNSYRYCQDLNENEVSDLWEIWLDTFVVTAERPEVDVSDILGDVFGNAYEEAYQAALAEITNVEIEVNFSDFWEEGDSDLVNMDGLTQEQKEQFNDTITAMCDNCLYAALINSLNGNVNLTVNPSQTTPGGYNAVTNTMSFPTSGAGQIEMSAEMFHALQNQLYGNLATIQTTPPHVGGSNVEFEEKMLTMVSGIINGLPFAMFPDIDPDMYFWLIDLLDANGGEFPNSFTAQQEQEYMDFLTYFQQYNAIQFPGSIYGSPIDPDNDFPQALHDILSASDCE